MASTTARCGLRLALIAGGSPRDARTCASTRSTPQTSRTYWRTRPPPSRALTSTIRGPRDVHLPSTCSTPRCSPNAWTVRTHRSTSRRTALASWSGGQCRPVSWNDGSAVGQFCETLENTHSPSCITRSTSNSTPSRYSSSSRSLPARKIACVSGRRDRADQGVDRRAATRVVDADAPDRARAELGLDHRRGTRRTRRRRTARRATAPAGPRRRQAELGAELPGAHLAAGGVDGLGRVAGQPQRRAPPGPPRNDAVSQNVRTPSGRTPARGQRVERPPRRPRRRRR